MDTQQNQVFAAALTACEKLHALFPADRQLMTVIQRLKEWQQGRTTAPSTDTISASRCRNIDRLVRPLCEEVAMLVHEAELQAQELALA